MTRLLPLFALLLASLASAQPWDIDPGHTQARFTVRHLTVTDVTGTLGDVRGVLELDTGDVTRSKVTATIDAHTLTSRNTRRDNHLRSKDFLFSRKFPTLTFTSTSVVQQGDVLLVGGDLTIRDVTRSVVLEVRLSEPVVHPLTRQVNRGFTATTTLKRDDFGLTWNVPVGPSGVLVDNAVRVTIEGALLQRESAAPAQ